VPFVSGATNLGEALRRISEGAAPWPSVVEEGGIGGNAAQVVDLKTTCAPMDLLNPGKLGDSFFTSRGLHATQLPRAATHTPRRV
jgi:hypothetical protein